MTNLLNFLHSNTWGGRSLSTIRVKPYHRPFGTERSQPFSSADVG